ncbi:unnamed protein product [Peniophora sp. CBMAI 1063]|nr:unnamed protein product [Peniophora sp. CBMAI 1063]
MGSASALSAGSVYYAVMANRGQENEERATSGRNFCKQCGSMLWLFMPQWPESILPYASAIDTPLLPAEEMGVIMLASKPDWVRLPEGKKKTFEHYPDESPEQWHKRHGLWIE